MKWPDLDIKLKLLIAYTNKKTVMKKINTKPYIDLSEWVWEWMLSASVIERPKYSNTNPIKNKKQK